VSDGPAKTDELIVMWFGLLMGRGQIPIWEWAILACPAVDILKAIQ